MSFMMRFNAPSLLLCMLIAASGMTNHVEAASVCSVHDGDTFQLCYGPTVRLWGIDAPEIAQPYGKEAQIHLEQLLKGKTPTLTCADSSYKRWVCLVEVDGQNINYQMVHQGFAYAEPRYSEKTYRITEKEAQTQKAGLWSQPDGGERPWVYRKKFKHQSEETSNKHTSSPGS